MVTELAVGRHPGTGEVPMRPRPGFDPTTGEPWHRRRCYDFALRVPQSYSTACAAALAAGDGATAGAMRRDLIDGAACGMRFSTFETTGMR